MPPRGRYAPSPTGELHLGNASTALLAWLSVRSRRGALVLRVEDLDRARVRPGLDRAILDDLAWLGLDWDEGPDRGGPHAPYFQTQRLELYARYAAQLVESGHAYECFATSEEVEEGRQRSASTGRIAPNSSACRRTSGAVWRRGKRKR